MARRLIVQPYGTLGLHELAGRDANPASPCGNLEPDDARTRAHDANDERMSIAAPLALALEKVVL
jgi:hypothetical protein